MIYHPILAISPPPQYKYNIQQTPPTTKTKASGGEQPAVEQAC